MAEQILVVEDDAVVAETLEAYLLQAGYRVSLARDGRQGLALARSAECALVILDLMIPGMSGLDVCRELRRVSQVPVLMLTARTTEDDRIRGFERGADDYVGKPFSPREVVCRVQALLRRAPTAETSRPSPDRHGVVEIDRWARKVRVEGRDIDLTRTEFGLLDAVVRADGRPLTRDELLGRVFGADYEGSDRTVDTHLANLRRKLDPAHPQRFIATTHGVGYRWCGSDA
jgi:two-component system alkaline phosphatase synthesis response regulator PhoP